MFPAQEGFEKLVKLEVPSGDVVSVVEHCFELVEYDQITRTP